MARRVTLATGLECSECAAASSSLFERSDRYWTHCLNCGSQWFFQNPGIADRVAHGRPVCLHDPPRVQTRRGYTRWCPICRTRHFRPPPLVQQYLGKTGGVAGQDLAGSRSSATDLGK